MPVLKQMFSWASEARFQTGPSTTPWCIYIATRSSSAFVPLGRCARTDKNQYLASQ